MTKIFVIAPRRTMLAAARLTVAALARVDEDTEVEVWVCDPHDHQLAETQVTHLHRHATVQRARDDAHRALSVEGCDFDIAHIEADIMSRLTQPGLFLRAGSVLMLKSERILELIGFGTDGRSPGQATVCAWDTHEYVSPFDPLYASAAHTPLIPCRAEELMIVIPPRSETPAALQALGKHTKDMLDRRVRIGAMRHRSDELSSSPLDAVRMVMTVVGRGQSRSLGRRALITDDNHVPLASMLLTQATRQPLCLSGPMAKVDRRRWAGAIIDPMSDLPFLTRSQQLLPLPRVLADFAASRKTLPAAVSRSAQLIQSGHDMTMAMYAPLLLLGIFVAYTMLLIRNSFSRLPPARTSFKNRSAGSPATLISYSRPYAASKSRPRFR